MREWLLVVFPLVVILYFLFYPEELGPTINWVRSIAGLVVAALP
ncbi:MAG: hypothetical protein ACRECV_10350 [Xanthobacteraceae bacterium]